MASSINTGVVISAGFGGALSGSFDVGTNPSALVMVSTEPINSPAIGGQALSYYNHATFLGSETWVYVLLEPAPMSGSQAVTGSNGGSGTALVFEWAVHVNGTPSIIDSHFGGSAAGAGNWTADSGVEIGFWLGGVDTNFYSGMVGTGVLAASSHPAYWGHEPVATNGSRAAGINQATGSAGFVLIAGGDLEINPTPVGAQGGVRSGVIAASGTPNLQTGRIRPAYAGIRAGSIDYASQRQVLVVGGVAEQEFEQPETTEGGSEGDILTQHSNRKPSWESPSSLPLSKWREPVRMDNNGDGTYDDWLLADNGDVIMMEKVGD